MKLKINNNEILKYELLSILRESKLLAIKFIVEKTNISLKDAKDYIDNLSINESYYDNKEIDFDTKEELIRKTKEVKKESQSSKIQNPQFIKPKKSKVFLFYGVAIVIIIVFYFSTK